MVWRDLWQRGGGHGARGCCVTRNARIGCRWRRTLSQIRVRLTAEDTAAYRERSQRRDQIVLRVLTALAISGQTARLFFDAGLAGHLFFDGVLFRLFGLACFATLFGLSFHTITRRCLHAVVGVGYLLATASLAAAYAAVSWQAPLVNSTMGIALILLSAFSFGTRQMVLVAVAALVVAVIHMPLAGMGSLALPTRLVGCGVVGLITVTASWFLDQHWRRGFLVERALERSHADLRRAHRDLEAAHAVLIDQQGQLVRAERSAALGRLVASLAHQINAPVGIQVSLASHLTDQTDRFTQRVASGELRRADLTDYLTTARDSSALLLDNACRMANLVTTLKQINGEAGNDGERGVEVVDVSDLLLRLRPAMEALLPPQVTLAVEAATGAKVFGASTLLDTILHQTVSNAARHAFPDGRPGAVRVCVRPETDGRVALTVADDGCGIAPEHLERVFDPFYTDGAIGGSATGGDGLGLSLVHSMVVGPLCGHIAIDSRVGVGTTVTVRLPAAA